MALTIHGLLYVSWSRYQLSFPCMTKLVIGQYVKNHSLTVQYIIRRVVSWDLSIIFRGTPVRWYTLFLPHTMLSPHPWTPKHLHHDQSCLDHCPVWSLVPPIPCICWFRRPLPPVDRRVRYRCSSIMLEQSWQPRCVHSWPPSVPVSDSSLKASAPVVHRPPSSAHSLLSNIGLHRWPAVPELERVSEVLWVSKCVSRFTTIHPAEYSPLVGPLIDIAIIIRLSVRWIPGWRSLVPTRRQRCDSLRVHSVKCMVSHVRRCPPFMMELSTVRTWCTKPGGCMLNG